MTSTSLCPRFHRAIELVGSRWTGAILQILLGGRARFTTIGAAIPEISDRMLSERLHELERERIVMRTVIPESPIRVEYELSEKGRELQASLTSIAKWAERWLSSTGDPAPAPAKTSRRPAAAKRLATRRAPAKRRATARRKLDA